MKVWCIQQLILITFDILNRGKKVTSQFYVWVVWKHLRSDLTWQPQGGSGVVGHPASLTYKLLGKQIIMLFCCISLEAFIASSKSNHTATFIHTSARASKLYYSLNKGLHQLCNPRRFQTLSLILKSVNLKRPTPCAFLCHRLTAPLITRCGISGQETANPPDVNVILYYSRFPSLL